jgi:hypothetical protein
MKAKDITLDQEGRFELIGTTPGGGLALAPRLNQRIEAAAAAIQNAPWSWSLGTESQADLGEEE